LLDRIRRLEQTLENIESGALTVAAAAPMQQEPVRPSVPKAELPKAIPEDVKHIVEAWGGFWSNTSQPMKSYLKGARLSLGGDNRLLLVLEDGLASDYFLKEPANREALENMLADFAGKQVDIEIRSVQDRQEMERSYVDLSQVIHMDIEEE
ncbi:MAG: DNA polymerase III subunit gamma/tau, partial [Eisenbergiella sp.]